MGVILVSPQNIEEQQLLLDLLKRMGISARILSDEEEDEALGILIDVYKRQTYRSGARQSEKRV